ncbi:MAG: gamma-glutamylcyclotransferase, partial [Conexibacter sp.]|nr:gamma-glutamylcyclotransferase [Conexibacter sp.]
MSGHVFGYASLVAAPAVARATLRGHRRVWGVAMDNAVAVPGYKVYALPDGSRPAVAVAFLDLEADAAFAVDGALLAVDDAGLAALDARERQYERVDVTALVDPAPGGPVWSYAGRAPGRARVAAG